jgi:hypothetical protein
MARKVKLSSFTLKHTVFGEIAVDRAAVTGSGSHVVLTVSTKRAPSRAILIDAVYWKQPTRVNEVFAGLLEFQEKQAKKRTASEIKTEKMLRKIQALNKRERDQSDESDEVEEVTLHECWL